MGGAMVHYVSKFYLKNFGNPFWYYDKQTGARGQAYAKNRCCEWNFYTDDDKSTDRLETEMSQIEGRASRAIRKVVQTEDFVGLPDRDKNAIHEFIALHLVRTLEARIKYNARRKALLDALKRIGVPDLDTIEDRPGREFHLDAVRNYRSLTPWIEQKTACLCKNETSLPLWTSDNPVALHNNLPNGGRGVGSPGVQITLPLTPELALFIYDKAAYEDLPPEAYFAETLSPGPTPVLRSVLPEGKDLMEEGHVTLDNNLQVWYSTQYVFSNTSKFYMIEHMIGECPADKYNYLFRTP